MDNNPIKSISDFSKIMSVFKEAPPEFWKTISDSGGMTGDGMNEVYGRYEQQLARIANRLTEISDTLKKLINKQE